LAKLWLEDDAHAIPCIDLRNGPGEIDGLFLIEVLTYGVEDGVGHVTVLHIGNSLCKRQPGAFALRVEIAVAPVGEPSDALGRLVQFFELE
jgi:hypothetical protein